MAVSAVAACHREQIGAEMTSANLTELVVREAVSAAAERFAPRLQSLILTGSMARAESTFVRTADGWETLGDCEMVLVVQSKEPLPAAADVARAQQELERRLEHCGLACPVGMSPVHPSYLENLPPHIYGYELRSCGRVIWGDARILSLIPKYSAADIPREDAWRLVCNRMIEQLGIVGKESETAHASGAKADYRTVKLCLDLATSLLLFCGEYAPTYQGRCARLQSLAENYPAEKSLPFPLPAFSALVQKLTNWKLTPGAEPLDADLQLRPTVWEYARQLWRWEILRLTGEVHGLSNSRLMGQWMRSQPLRRRVRGWASLARKHGWMNGWREWPHWLRLGLTSSPRYWVYAAASELFFRLPELMDDSGSTGPDRNLGTWRKWLPVRPEQNAATTLPWRQLASEITWNYRQFLMETYS